jgi:hypothetical protein
MVLIPAGKYLSFIHNSSRIAGLSRLKDSVCRVLPDKGSVSGIQHFYWSTTFMAGVTLDLCKAGCHPHLM